MAAMAAARAWGVPFSAMQDVLRSYRPPRHRWAWPRRRSESINDSKATNIHAMESALRGMAAKVVLIAGGKDKQLDYAPVRPLIRKQTTHVFTIGEISKALAECWKDDSECRACASCWRKRCAARLPRRSRGRWCSLRRALRLSICLPGMTTGAMFLHNSFTN